VDVGHDADLAVREGLGVADLADLLHGTVVHGGGEALGGVVLSNYFNHETVSFRELCLTFGFWGMTYFLR
jgi:hypothetical protein